MFTKLMLKIIFKFKFSTIDIKIRFACINGMTTTMTFYTIMKLIRIFKLLNQLFIQYIYNLDFGK